MAGERILIVDDNELNLKLLRVTLLGEGYDVATARDADEALASLEQLTPRVILMDIQLPGTDGLELTRRIKGDPRWASVPIVAVTSYAMKGDRERALAAGCEEYITKPIDTRTFPGLVAGVIARASGART
jgi:CheY-like chemotaxis protein